MVCFDRAFAATKRTRAEALRIEDARSLAEAAQLYRGDLLEGWFAEWCLYERERFRRMYLSLLDTLADHWEARQEYEAAIAYATLALRYDAARERTHRSLMRLLAKSGDRTGGPSASTSGARSPFGRSSRSTRNRRRSRSSR